MSLKFAAVKISENHFILPKVGNMKTEVNAFFSQKLYDESDEGLWTQAMQAACTEGAIGMYLMPDGHLGYSIPIGGVLVTEDTIVQAGSGYDISCGVIYAKTDLTIADIQSKEARRNWINAVEERISTGYGKGKAKKAPKVKASMEDILRYGAKALNIKSTICEREFIPVDEATDVRKIQAAFDKTTDQLGTVGGGNHFVEMQIAEDGSVWVMIHCGSRGYGYKTAEHFFYAGAELRGLPKNQREQSWLRLDEPLGREYWAHHNTAANYAIANRHLISEGIKEATEEVFGKSMEVFYEISHNLVQEETLLLPDGTQKKGFVHRKGATRAFPANHPELMGTEWEKTGHPILIPGSMLHGAAILFAKNSQKSGCSVNHGSGRVLGRNKAKIELKPLQEDINKEMADVVYDICGERIEGIMCNTRNVPLDESAHCYKNLDEVLDVLVKEEIATIHKRLWPLANIKAMD